MHPNIDALSSAQAKHYKNYEIKYFKKNQKPNSLPVYTRVNVPCQT